MQINYEDSLEAKSYRDYKGNRTCKKYRDIGEGLELTKETGIAYQRKVAHAEIIKGVADGIFKLDEVEDLIDQGIAVVYLSLSSFDNEALHKKTNREEVEERRRVLYVAITRAMDELYITGEYVAYGKKDDYTYNQFLKDVFVSLGRVNEYVPIDPMEAAREEKRKEERRRKDRERRASKKAVDAINMLQMAGKWNTMTPEQIEEYEKTYKGATQMTFDDLVMPKAS